VEARSRLQPIAFTRFNNADESAANVTVTWVPLAVSTGNVPTSVSFLAMQLPKRTQTESSQSRSRGG